jgi:hypothetical protein
VKIPEGVVGNGMPVESRLSMNLDGMTVLAQLCSSGRSML